MTGTCNGIQHPALEEFPPGDSRLPYCHKRWSLFRGAWRHKECQFISETLDSSDRCPKCKNAYSNIRPKRYSELFPKHNVSEPSMFYVLDVTV